MRDTIETRSDRFVRLVNEIHARPEPAFAEEYATARTSEALADQGFTVRAVVHGLPTAFIASAGDGPLHIASCA